MWKESKIVLSVFEKQINICAGTIDIQDRNLVMILFVVGPWFL